MSSYNPPLPLPAAFHETCIHRDGKGSRYQNQALKTRINRNPRALYALLDKLKEPLLGYRMRCSRDGFGKVYGSVGQFPASEQATAAINSPAIEGEIDHA
jgi:hypothetical protein